jgi:hypothetical protein
MVHWVGFEIIGELRHYLLKGNALTRVGPDTLFGDVVVLEVLEIFENGLAGVVALRPARLLGEGVEAGFDFWRQAQGKHVMVLRCYTCIAPTSR